MAIKLILLKTVIISFINVITLSFLMQIEIDPIIGLNKNSSQERAKMTFL